MYVGGHCGRWLCWYLGFVSSNETHLLCTEVTDAHTLWLSAGLCTMSCDQTYPFPQVFLVDQAGGLQQPDQPPNLVPCWSFPPPQERARSRRKSWSCMGVSPSIALVVLMLFLLVFGALGFESYQIFKMQKELIQLGEVRSHRGLMGIEKKFTKLFTAWRG